MALPLIGTRRRSESEYHRCDVKTVYRWVRTDKLVEGIHYRRNPGGQYRFRIDDPAPLVELAAAMRDGRVSDL